MNMIAKAKNKFFPETPENFRTTSKKNADGEIINPTASDIKRFNSKFSTYIPKK